MNLPSDKNLYTRVLTQIYNNTVATYKYYWFVSILDIVVKEQRALWLVVTRCKILIQKRFNPDGFNVGINVGESAGQSIFHVHIHLIPRYKGDVENPLGGVRGVIPNKQKY